MKHPLLLSTAFLLGAAFGLASVKPQKRYSFRGRSVLITGGSRGLGLEMARQLAKEGARLTIVGRDPYGLKRAEYQLKALGAEVLTLTCDVREENEVNDAVTRTISTMGRLDVLINNAGIIQVGPLDEMKLEDFEEAMAVHFFGPLYFTLAALPHMRPDEGGRIVNISSVGGKIAVPHLLPYTASKFALAGLSEGLRTELTRRKILVTTVYPGLMRTGSARNAVFKGKHRKEYAWFSISGSLPLLSIHAGTAARRIIEACRRGRARLLIGAPARAAVMLNEIAPGATVKFLAAANHLLPQRNSGTGQAKLGHESQSPWSPSWLTRLNEKAAQTNNEVLGTPNYRR